ncbi:MAG: DEAD/DEAH box helicase [Synechococcus sp.]|nr:DEAD/DEAH box helicase [Synechococcus sp.]
MSETASLPVVLPAEPAAAAAAGAEAEAEASGSAAASTASAMTAGALTTAEPAAADERLSMAAAAQAPTVGAGQTSPDRSREHTVALSDQAEPVAARDSELQDDEPQDSELPAGEPNAAAVSEPDADGFARFGLDPELLRALADLGFVTPSPIQQAAIPELLLGRDLVGQAQTGTGKTAAFGLPLLHCLDRELRAPQVLVLTPTRELAIQVADAIASYATHLVRLRVVPIYGGSDFREQIQQLRRGPQVVVGTPGRVMDHMRQGTLDLSRLRTLVLDEADEMLRMGFIDDVEWVLEQLPQERQVVLFSATMPREIRQLSHRYLRDPAEVTIRTNSADGRRIRQRHLLVHPSQKLEALERVLEAERQEGVIIFARTKAVTLTVAESLESHGYDVAVLNGDVPQAQRERTIERLRDGRVDVLVATDVAARGLDVERIQLVINYDIPFDAEAYVHRIGRTGRAGRCGEAILFLTPRERRFLTGLERAVGQPIEAMEVPANATINQHRLDRLRERLTSSHRASPVNPQERALLSEIVQRVARECDCSADELAVAALSLSLAGKPLLQQGEERWAGSAPRQGREVRDGREPRDGRDGRERSGPVGGRRPGQEAQDGPPEPHMERFRIEVGWRDRVKPGNIVGAIANEAGLNGRAIGRIRIFDAHSTVDLPRGMPETVFRDLQRLKVMNRELQISRWTA